MSKFEAPNLQNLFLLSYYSSSNFTQSFYLFIYLITLILQYYHDIFTLPGQWDKTIKLSLLHLFITRTNSWSSSYIDMQSCLDTLLQVQAQKVQILIEQLPVGS